MLKTIKKILSVIGVLFVLFVVWALLSDDESVDTTVQKQQQEVVESDDSSEEAEEDEEEVNDAEEDVADNDEPEEVADDEQDVNEEAGEDNSDDAEEEDDGITKELNKSAGAEYGDEYRFKLDNGDVAKVKTPQCIRENYIDNLTDERELALFSSIFTYGYTEGEGVDIVPVPNDDYTFREMLKASDAVGTIFNFTIDLISPDGSGMLIGDLIGDKSVENVMTIDVSYIGDEKYDLMGGETISFNAVYAGLDDIDPIFVALDMDILEQ